MLFRQINKQNIELDINIAGEALTKTEAYLGMIVVVPRLYINNYKVIN